MVYLVGTYYREGEKSWLSTGHLHVLVCKTEASVWNVTGKADGAGTCSQWLTEVGTLTPGDGERF